MKAVVKSVQPGAKSSTITVEIAHGDVPDFVYAPPSEAVKADAKAFEQYQEEIQEKRRQHVLQHKNERRATKALVGRVVDLVY